MTGLVLALSAWRTACQFEFIKPRKAVENVVKSVNSNLLFKLVTV